MDQILQPDGLDDNLWHEFQRAMHLFANTADPTAHPEYRRLKTHLISLADWLSHRCKNDPTDDYAADMLDEVRAMLHQSGD